MCKYSVKLQPRWLLWFNFRIKMEFCDCDTSNLYHIKCANILYSFNLGGCCGLVLQFPLVLFFDIPCTTVKIQGRKCWFMTSVSIQPQDAT